jgi:hypothetical protein
MDNAFDRMMPHLDPRTIALVVDIPHEQARNSYGIVEEPRSMHDFQSKITDFYVHICESTGMGARSKEHAFAEATQIVENAFGNNGGLEGAYEIARVGSSRGIYQSFEAIANYLREEARRHYIRYIIDTHIAADSFDEKVKVIREILDTYKTYGNTFGVVRPESLAHDYYGFIANVIQNQIKNVPIYSRLKE